MKKTLKLYEDIPLEVGKTYMTKFASGEKFTITKIPAPIKIKDSYKESNTVYGLYEGKSYGECPLSRERIIHDKKFIREIEVCHKCGESIEEHEQHYRSH
jgi:hypothetical protein